MFRYWLQILLCGVAINILAQLAYAAERSELIDPYKPVGSAALMKTGEFIGQPIDVDWRRSGVRLSEEQARAYFSDFDAATEIAIANVKQFDRWYVARIPITGVKRVYFNRYRILEKVAANHVGLRFEMKPGTHIQLVGQVLGENLPSLQFDSLGFGVYAVGPKGVKFGARHSRKRNLVSAYLFFTPAHLMQRYRKDAIKKDMEEIWLDAFSESETQFLLRSLSREATLRGYQDAYAMFLNNCVRRLLVLLDRSRFKQPFNELDGLIKVVQGYLPTGAVNWSDTIIDGKLRRRGLISSQVKWKHILHSSELAYFEDIFEGGNQLSPESLLQACALYHCKPGAYFGACLARKKTKITRCIAKNEASPSLRNTPSTSGLE